MAQGPDFATMFGGMMARAAAGIADSADQRQPCHTADFDAGMSLGRSTTHKQLDVTINGVISEAFLKTLPIPTRERLQDAINGTGPLSNKLRAVADLYEAMELRRALPFTQTPPTMTTSAEETAATEWARELRLRCYGYRLVADRTMAPGARSTDRKLGETRMHPDDVRRMCAEYARANALRSPPRPQVAPRATETAPRATEPTHDASLPSTELRGRLLDLTTPDDAPTAAADPVTPPQVDLDV